MNISELARKLNVSTQDLKDQLPDLGFDIGQKAIKVDERQAQRIIQAWQQKKKKDKEEKAYLKAKHDQEEKETSPEKGEVQIPPVLTVKDFASLVQLPVTKVIQELMKNGVMASLNERIDYDTAAIIAEELGYSPVPESEDAQADLSKEDRVKQIISREKQLLDRPPVVVVMGHVDHGKTKLLDTIRKSNVVEGEAGGITQHIGAYQVQKKGQKITFIDTPGHEAFTAMRSRGAKVADIAILIVAANDSVKPQTIEAIKIIEQAKIPMIVAINKIDLPDANVEKTKQDLTAHHIIPEDWGGKTMCVPISAKQGINIDDLLESILLLAEMEKDHITANPEGELASTVIESHVDKGEGPVATILIKNGTLHVGDILAVDGVYYGKIRAMKDYRNKDLSKAEPSTPVKILGLKIAPKVGEVLQRLESKKQSKKADYYQLTKKEESFVKAPQVEENEDLNKAVLNIVLKSDVLGSQGAILESLAKMEDEDIKINVTHRGLGNITEGDVLNAEANHAFLFGFNVTASPAVAELARERGVEIRTFRIIYELLEEVKKELGNIIKTEIVREETGKIEVLASFKKDKDFQIVGGKLIEGTAEPGSKAAVLRNQEFVTSGKLSQIQCGKEEVQNVVKGQECGVRFEGSPLIEVGDILEVYKEKEVRKTIH